MISKNSKLEILILGKDDHSFAPELKKNAHSNGWSIRWLSEIPSSISPDCLILTLDSQSFSSVVSQFQHQCFFAINPQDVSVSELTPHTLLMSNHLLDEAWSIYLRESLHRLLPPDCSSRTRALAFLAAGLAQTNSKDLGLLEATIAECIADEAGPNDWHVGTPLARLLYLCAKLALEHQDKSHEEFRNALRTQSAGLPFHLRSEIRMSCEICFSRLWGESHAA